MSVKLISGAVVREVLAELEEVIRTKDVSCSSAMLAAHAGLMPKGVYNSSVGKYLANCGDVERLDGMPRSTQGQAWRNLLSRAPANAGSSRVVEEVGAVDPVQDNLELGPQYAADEPFTARMRLHQSWYRAKVLRVPFGVGPMPEAQNSYGNMLRASDGANGLNFLTSEIFDLATRRAAENPRNIERFRLLHNMLSSQPLCFNLFAPLVMDLKLATQLMAAVPELSVARVTSVVLETTPGLYLGDNTSFDAYIEYEQTDGKPAFLGVEVKLTEPFSKKVYDRGEYRRWMDGERSPWSAEAAAQVTNVAHNQLWRDHLLAIAHRDHPASQFAQGRLMLLRHPKDRRCERIVSNYRGLLRVGDDSLLDMTLDRLISAWKSAALSGKQRAWLDALEQRYLRLELSAPTGGAR